MTRGKLGLTVTSIFTALEPMRTPDQALQDAIACFDSQAAFAAALSAVCDKPVSSQAISQWKSVPEERCEPIETITGGKVRVEELRPEIQWRRNPQGQVIQLFPAPRDITPTTLKRAKR